jgi:predicted unusual protein kinase regulating ubiquinone biosynthesis (AarF/ABC1/UbiB family)
VSGVAEKDAPEGRLGRLARLASLGVRAGASAVLSGDGHDAAAKQALEVLGSLRGLAAKVGQMASYVDGVVPEGHRDAYEAPRGLRAAAPTSSPEGAIIVEAELGAPRPSSSPTWEERPSRARPSARCTARPSTTAARWR